MARLLLIVLALASALPARATEIAAVKCPANQDRIWVYDSLATFDVETKLRCGETVEIVSRVKGYVQIRTANGVEGYVPDSVFPGLPPLEDDKGKPAASPTPRPAASAPSTPSAQPAKAGAELIVQPLAPASVPAANPVRQPATSAARASDQPSPALIAAKAPASPVTMTLVDSNTVVPPRAIAAPQSAASLDEDDEYPAARSENESADPACRTYFSAYGLAPSQYKWMADARRKDHASVCPAPDPESVDYVILFTHDTASFTSAMPASVHVDHSGFSDFSPLTTIDTALISPVQAEKARYEFVWVFHVKRGAFDPARFSPRRRPQFTTSESKGSRSAQIIEDAFRYIEEQSPTR